MSANKKLAVGVLLIASATGYMAYLGGEASWQYYLTVDECTAEAAPPLGARVRVSGRISPNTLGIYGDGREAVFSLEGSQETRLAVTCPGPLPDNLAEGMDVVVEGRLEDHHFLKGHKVITRCASKYRSQAAVRPTETASRDRLGGSR
jgi:cytochrome c-type biogenesis protein CcmE